jgi:uncharacterized protein (DUF849 family)
LKPTAHFKPEVASLNMGSMNFGLFPMLGATASSSTTGSGPYLAGSDERIFKNTFKDIENILNTCRANDTRFEIECYDIGHLYTLRHFADRGLVKPPFFIQSVFGILGGIGPHPEDVAHMRRTADRLFGHEYQWSVLGAGRNQLPIAAQSVASVETSASASRIHSGSAPASSPRATPCRCAPRARSSRGWALKSPRPTRRARCSSSRAGQRVNF